MFTIYLDIDGVLSPYNYFAQNRMFSSKTVTNLGRFINYIDETLHHMPLHICFIGAWARKYDASELTRILKSYHFSPNTELITYSSIIDSTYDKHNVVADHEKINAITSDNKFYIIIDDEIVPFNSEQQLHILKPISSIGFSEDDIITGRKIVESLWVSKYSSHLSIDRVINEKINRWKKLCNASLKIIDNTLKNEILDIQNRICSDFFISPETIMKLQYVIETKFQYAKEQKFKTKHKYLTKINQIQEHRK